VESAPVAGWYKADLHIHTPGSIDYQESTISPIDLLRTAADQGLQIIALTDHNAVSGWMRLRHELEDLEFLEHRNQLSESETALLAEYRDLLGKILVLPGFEFTATFGFHILAIFDPRTTLRMMEHLLLLLGVPEDRFGSGEVGATSDVLRAYDVLAEAGAIVIGAHVNSTHGVAMRNIKFGGQTKIAYTQDKNLAALEVTDLQSTSSRSTAHFFNGTKAEYPRRMHCIQGSDAHRLQTDPNRPTNLGIGDRATEFYLPERTFAALKNLLASTAWDHVRPARSGGPAALAIDDARAVGSTSNVVFVEKSPTTSKAGMQAMIRDVAALANSQGGTLYVGVGPAGRRTIPGAGNADDLRSEIDRAIAAGIDPGCPVQYETVMYEHKPVLIMHVPLGDDRPYALASGEIPVRRGAESVNARRDEILILARGGSLPESRTVPAVSEASPDKRSTRADEQEAPTRRTRGRSSRSARPAEDSGDRIAPRTGVEIVEATEIDGVMHYTLRDLRTDQITRNVTVATARSLWAQAIREYERDAPNPDRIEWHGNLGFWKSSRISNGERRYHLVTREADGAMRVYFGVSGDGLPDEWQDVIEDARRLAGAPAETATAQ